MPRLRVIVPAHNEEVTITDCLRSLIWSVLPPDWTCEIVVAANGCSDRTVEIAEELASDAAAEGKCLNVIDLPEASKPNALNAAGVDGARVLAYIDADVCVSPTLLSKLIEILDVPVPRYASGRVTPVCADSFIVRRYAEVWARLPYVRNGVPGCGVFAVNDKGRDRWTMFPSIIADDMFARLQFAPHERFAADAPYSWPLPRTARDLVRVRNRWKLGNKELKEKLPALMENEAAGGNLRSYLRIALRAPLSSMVFGAVCIAAAVRGRKRSTQPGWARAARESRGASGASRSRRADPGGPQLSGRCP